MAKAKITLPDGISVTVDGTPDEIASVVARFQDRPGEVEAERSPSESKAGRGKRRSRRLQVTDLVANLIDGGFFKKPKDLAAVKGALEEMGHHYPVTTLSPTMLRQVRKRNLRRIKQDRRWMYTG
jgi:hypothetical protein